jgi:hypothetical protein
LPNSSTILSTAAQLHARWKALAKQKRTIYSCAYHRTEPIQRDRMSKNGKQQCAKKSRFGKSDDFSGAGKS